MYILVDKTIISSYLSGFLQNVLHNKERKPDSDVLMLYAKDYSDETFSVYHGTCSAFLNLYPY